MNWGIFKTDSVSEAYKKMKASSCEKESKEGKEEKVEEELKGDQHKIDANKNGKVDAHDFKLLRSKKKVSEESDEHQGEQLAEMEFDKNGRYVHHAKPGVYGG